MKPEIRLAWKKIRDAKKAEEDLELSKLVKKTQSPPKGAIALAALLSARLR